MTEPDTPADADDNHTEPSDPATEDPQLPAGPGAAVASAPPGDGATAWSTTTAPTAPPGQMGAPIQMLSDAAVVTGGVAGAAAVARTWLTQRGETKREQIRQEGMTTRAKLGHPDADPPSSNPSTDDNSDIDESN